MALCGPLVNKTGSRPLIRTLASHFHRNLNFKPHSYARVHVHRTLQINLLLNTCTSANTRLSPDFETRQEQCHFNCLQIIVALPDNRVVKALHSQHRFNNVSRTTMDPSTISSANLCLVTSLHHERAVPELHTRNLHIIPHDLYCGNLSVCCVCTCVGCHFLVPHALSVTMAARSQVIISVLDAYRDPHPCQVECGFSRDDTFVIVRLFSQTGVHLSLTAESREHDHVDTAQCRG